MKHEFNASYRTYLPIYLALYILSLLIFLTYKIDIRYLGGILIMLFSLLIGAMVIFTIYNLVISLGTRVYGKPGYLLFSIPAKTSEIMISKFVVNFIWILASIFVSVTAMMISFSLMGFLDDVRSIFGSIWGVLREANFNLFMLIVYVVVLITYYISFFMFMFALFNLLYKGERKVLFGILFYFALSFAIRTIISALSIPGVLGMIMGDQGSEPTFGALWYIMLIYFLVSAGMIVGTYFLINKKLELQ